MSICGDICPYMAIDGPVVYMAMYGHIYMATYVPIYGHIWAYVWPYIIIFDHVWTKGGEWSWSGIQACLMYKGLSETLFPTTRQWLCSKTEVRYCTSISPIWPMYDHVWLCMGHPLVQRKVGFTPVMSDRWSGKSFELADFYQRHAYCESDVWLVFAYINLATVGFFFEGIQLIGQYVTIYSHVWP